MLKWRVYPETVYNEVVECDVTYWVGDAYDPAAPEGRQVLYSAVRPTGSQAATAAKAYISKKNCGQH